MKDKILNISIIVLVIACLFLGGRLLYRNYMDGCEAYNNNIVNFAVEMIKGNKSLKDIDALDANDSVKESLRTYYTDNFYSDDDLILIYEDYKLLDEIILECNEFKAKAIVDGVYDDEIYYNLIMGAVERRMGEYFSEISESDFIDSPPLWDYTYMQYDYLKKDINDFEVREDGLYISLSDLYFIDAECIKYYKGYPISIYRDGLDKKIINEIQVSEKYQSISIKNKIEDDKIVDYIIKDFLSNDYSFTVGLNKGKIESLTFR